MIAATYSECVRVILFRVLANFNAIFKSDKSLGGNFTDVLFTIEDFKTFDAVFAGMEQLTIFLMPRFLKQREVYSFFAIVC